jgi:hypothetical protein
MEELSIAEIVAKSFVCLVALVPIIMASLIVLRRKGRTAEINVIWYAFSLIFVIWWTINFALYAGFIKLPWAAPPPPQASSLRSYLFENPDAKQARLDELERKETEARVNKRPEAWGRYLYLEARTYLTDTRAELGLVASILIVTIAPQLLNYVLTGFSGCAATPRYVWRFEKIAAWSLIKFLAAFGGISIAEALGIYAIYLDEYDGQFALSKYADFFLWGLGAVGLAFVVAVLQVYTLEIAQAWGDVWPKQPIPWPYRVHRFFTRNLPQQEKEPEEEEPEPETFDPTQIWDQLTPAQQQKLGAMIVRSLLEGGRAAMQIWGSLTPAQRQEVGALVVGRLCARRR